MAQTRSMVRISKLLSLMLRHRPQEFGIEVDKFGFANLDETLAALQKKDRNLSMADIEAVVYDGEKKRFQIEEGLIRARYGHSFPIDLGTDPTEPPEFLYKGVSPGGVEEVLENGLIPYDRQYVHLSFKADVAEQMARFEGVRGAVIRVHALRAHQEGVEFYDCGPTVLTYEVSANYLDLEPPNSRTDQIDSSKSTASESHTTVEDSAVSFGRRRKFSKRR